MKKYSFPFISFPLGALVVYDIEYLTAGYLFISIEHNVDLPAPLGAEMIYNLPLLIRPPNM